MIGIAANGSSRFVTAALIGRLGGPALLGVTQSAISLAQILALLWPTSAGSAASRFVAGARGRGDLEGAAAVASYLLRRNLAVCLGLGVVGAGLWWMLDFGALAGGGIVAALTVAYASYSLARGVQLGAGQVRRSAWLDVASASVGVVGVAALLAFGVRSMMLLAPIAVSYLLYSVFTRPPRTAARLGRGDKRQIVIFIWLGVLGTIASAGFLQASVLIARLADGRAFAGQYAAALALATPLSILGASVSLSLFPMLAEATSRGDLIGVKAQTTKATSALIAIMVCLVGPVALAGDQVVTLIWGDAFDVAGDIVPFLFVAVLLNTVSIPCVNALTSGSNRGMAISATTSVVGLLIGCASWALMVPVSSEVGVPAGYLSGVVVISAVPVAIIWRRDGHSWLRMWGRFIAGLAALIAGLVWQSRRRRLGDGVPESGLRLFVGLAAVVPAGPRGGRARGSAMIVVASNDLGGGSACH